jgi:hypothetical protein
MCPVCDRDDVTTTRHGVMREHKGDRWWAGRRQRCDGSGKPPTAWRRYL